MISLPEYCSFALNEEDRAINDALKNKKLFIVDYRVFDGLQGKKNLTVFYTENKTFYSVSSVDFFWKPK